MGVRDAVPLPPPAAEATGLLTLPWDRPLAEWDPRLLLEVPQRGISRHVVRFVASGGHVFALKEINERLARHEYRLLGEFEEEGLPTVSVLGICVDRPDDQEAILVTRYLEYSMSYRWLFSSPRGDHSAERLLDTLVELLVRLHLAGIFWGDCSLSNTLFRPDAGALAAYLVDAETVERHPTLSPGQRAYDVDLARERVGAELLDLQFGELLPPDIDPIEVAESLAAALRGAVERGHPRAGVRRRRAAVADRRAAPAAQRPRVRRRRGRADHLRRGRQAAGGHPRRRARAAPPGAVPADRARGPGAAGPPPPQRHPRLPRARGAEGGARVPESFVAHRWLAEVYQPVVDAIPPELVGRLAPAEVFHEVLEHRWFLSEQARRDVGTAEAAESYFATVLPRTPKEVTTPVGDRRPRPGRADRPSRGRIGRISVR